MDRFKEAAARGAAPERPPCLMCSGRGVAPTWYFHILRAINDVGVSILWHTEIVRYRLCSLCLYSWPSVAEPVDPASRGFKII